MSTVAAPNVSTSFEQTVNMLELLNEEELQAIQSVARVFLMQSDEANPFRPKTEREILASIERGIAQADAGEGQDALEALDDIVASLEGV